MCIIFLYQFRFFKNMLALFVVYGCFLHKDILLCKYICNKIKISWLHIRHYSKVILLSNILLMLWSDLNMSGYIRILMLCSSFLLLNKSHSGKFLFLIKLIILSFLKYDNKFICNLNYIKMQK